MKKGATFIFLLIISVICVKIFAQAPSNYRFSSKILDSTTVRLDSLSIIPESFSLTGLDTSDYDLDFVTATLRLRTPAAIGKTITYAYRVFSFDFSKPLTHKSTDLILPRFVEDPSARQLLAISPVSSGSLFDSQLQGNGSISRSVSVGNNQNFVLDANLNLQLSGFLAPDVEILANITDENLPLQPEGNTRYIKDFNKIFIQLKYKDVLKVDAGDIELHTPENSYFFQVNRQFLGLKCQVNTRFDSINRMTNVAGGGISKGKYVRNQITPIHGVQGPYKLSGEQNETNIVILSGSEQVYLDGILLTRGQDNDYVIDYNLGEVTFTAKHLISSESRIIVTFEYSDQYYARFNVFTNNEFVHEKNGKLALNINFFHEQDLKRQSIMPELTNEQMLYLSNVGDPTDGFAYPSAMLTYDFTGSEVLYHQIDTIVEGRTYHRIFRYAGNARDSVYRVSFSYVGQNRGDYVLSQSTVNGKLYRWVAPLNGVPQGDYSPVQILNPPQQRDFATVGARYQINDKFKVRTELAFSYTDHNLFSKVDDKDNAGLAYKLSLDYQNKLKNNKLQDSLWRYQLNLDYEYAHKNFSPLETFRDIEFARDYNLENDYSSAASEQMLQLTTGFAHPKCGSTLYSFNLLSRFGAMLAADNLFALRNSLVSQHHFKGWNWNASTAFLTSRDAVQTTRFLKSNNDFSKSFAKIKIGGRDNLEYNVFRLAESQEQRAGSYAFNEAIFYLTNNDSVGYEYNFLIKNRVDANPYGDILALNAIAHEAQVSFAFTRWKHNRLKGTAIYRNDRVRDTARNFFSEHNFVGSLDYAGNFWKNAVNITFYYETGSGLEQKKSYTFLKVATGQGTHVWNDYNHNGIEELEEFEIAAFQNEADYVKVWLPTNEYVHTTNNAMTASLQLRPANVWRSRKGFLGLLAKFSNTTTLRTNQKNISDNVLQAVNPFNFHLADSSLVSQSFNFKNNLSFTLPSNYFSADYVAMLNRGKSLLYYGQESSILSGQQLTLKIVPAKILIFKTLYAYSVKENASEYMNMRNYRILSHVLDNAVTLNLKCNLSFTALWSMTYRRNLSGTEKANLYQARLDADYRMRERGTVSLSLQYINVLYNIVDDDNALSYEMLDGLSVGNNFLWNLAYQTKLFEYLQLSLQYEGRIIDSGRLIHTGCLQLKALF